MRFTVYRLEETALPLRGRQSLLRFARRPHRLRYGPELAILLVLMAPILSDATDVKPVTLQAWDAYVRAAKTRMEERARGQIPFLAVDAERGVAQRVRTGDVLVEPGAGDSPHPVPNGLIHDWMGTVFRPKAHLDDVMAVVNNYERYKDFYKPMVSNSMILERTQDREKVTLLMMVRAYSVTATVETDNDVQIVRLNADKAYSLSTSVRVREIADYGKPSEHALPEDRGPGYVWRTFIVTRLEQRDGGVYAEIEMIALSRSIPLAFRWLIQPLAERLPRDILMATLKDMRAAVSQENIAASLKTQTTAQSVLHR